MTEYALGEITNRVFASQVQMIAGTPVVPFTRIEAFGRALRWELELSGASIDEVSRVRLLVRRVWDMCPELGPTMRLSVTDAFDHGFGLTIVPAAWRVH